jgi:hypothetical protein
VKLLAGGNGVTLAVTLDGPIVEIDIKRANTVKSEIVRKYFLDLLIFSSSSTRTATSDGLQVRATNELFRQ